VGTGRAAGAGRSTGTARTVDTGRTAGTGGAVGSEHPVGAGLAVGTAQAVAHAPRVPSWSAPVRAGASDPYDTALRTGRGPLFLRRTDGWLLPLEVERWCARPDAADLTALRRCEGAVLDIGCGPGRLVAELAARGHRVLGVDVSEAAVAHTARLGGRALRASVFDPLPDEGHWDTALLIDGNIGIGGNPHALLERTAALLAPGGLLLTETAPVDVDERVQVRIDNGHGTTGTLFPWARVGTRALLRYARRTGWRTAAHWTTNGRAFVALRGRA
jgi:SAM-dependent methyltransferase